MKRDWLIFTVGICSMIAAITLGAHQVVPAALTGVKPSETVLILDAGHGGEDGGTSTPSGVKESEINLRIVQKIDALLAFCGVNAVLTRNEDISLHSQGSNTLHEKKVSDLKNRATFINSYENALLVSVHQNYFTDPRYSGSQVFFASGDISRQWGERTQELLRQALNPDNNRKAKLLPNSVYLFQHISCPAILVECGFLSHGEEASLLLTDSYQRKLAVALTGACLKQLNTLQEFSGGD